MAQIKLSEQQVLDQKKLERAEYARQYYRDHKVKAAYYQRVYQHKARLEREKDAKPPPRRQKDTAFTIHSILEMTNMDKLAHVITDILDPRTDSVFTGYR